MESGASARGNTVTRTKNGRSRGGGTVEVDTAALTKLLGALTAMRDGNFRKRLPVSGDGVMAEIAARLQRGRGP